MPNKSRKCFHQIGMFFAKEYFFFCFCFCFLHCGVYGGHRSNKSPSLKHVSDLQSLAMGAAEDLGLGIA